MVLDVARFHEMEHIILACDINNIASYKTIEKLGCGASGNMEKQRIYRLDL